MEKTGVLVPPENVLPWVETFYSQELNGRDRLSKPRAFLMSGTVEYGGASYRAEIFESQKWSFEWRAEISLRENYRMTPIYRDAWDDSVLYFLSIDGHIYTVQVYAGREDAPGCHGLFRRSPAGGVSHGGGFVSVMREIAVMKRKNGKKVRKIILLVILAIVAGVVLYDLVFCWPVHPSLQKPAESYEQLSQTAKSWGSWLRRRISCPGSRRSTASICPASGASPGPPAGIWPGKLSMTGPHTRCTSWRYEIRRSTRNIRR